MTKKYIDAEKLKAEIERHIKEVKDAAKRFTPNIGFFDAKLSGIYDVMAIIDSLHQEQYEMDLAEQGITYKDKVMPTTDNSGNIDGYCLDGENEFAAVKAAVENGYLKVGDKVIVQIRKMSEL